MHNSSLLRYKNNYFSFILLLFVLVLCALPSALKAQKSQALSGKELAQKVHDRYVGDNSIAKVKMQLISEDGYVRKRRLTVITQHKNGLRNSFIRFTEPADIAGTGFLALENKDGETDQFLYLPALNRTRRIVSSQKGRSFVNTDFTYEDMQRRDIEEFSHSITGQESISGLDCWILESKPLSASDSEYYLVKSWVPKDIFLPVKTHYFDKNEKHIKTYTVNSLKRVQEIWTPLKVKMKDLQDEHATTMHTTQIKYNTDVKDSFFTKRYLERW